MAKIVSIHSFRGGTGKSNVTANTAAQFAAMGHRVGVIDTDIQSPGIHVLFGMDEEQIASGLHVMFEALGKLRVHSAVLHLPGRPERLPAERAMRILLEVAAGHPDHDEVVLVEPVEAQRTMKSVLQGRRPGSRG